MRITFYCNLYVSEALSQPKSTLIRKLQKNALQPSVYVITLSQGTQNHLEFYSALLYKQHIYEDTPVFVVGIAKGYEDAMYMVEKIVNDSYRETGTADIRRYILRRQQEYKEGSV